MEKIVVKTAVKTLLILLGIVVAVFAVFNFAFPQHMATLTEGMGNYNLAVKYASLRYHYTHDCDDLARCFEDSVLLGNDDYILQYGEPLKEHHDYADVCRTKNEERTGSGYDYARWVDSKLSVSLYNKGTKAKAIELAAEVNGTDSFVYGSPLMSLAARIRSNQDAEAATAMLAVLEGISPADSVEKDNLTQVIITMRQVSLYGAKG